MFQVSRQGQGSAKKASFKLQAEKGFTLIEILIVVAIIGILASVVLVGLGPVQKQGRDARRVSDLRQVQNGLELYFNKNGSYPPTSDWASLKTALTGAAIGVSNVPNDPRNSSPYVYQYASNGSSYVLAAQLEDDNNPVLKDDVDGTVLGINCGSGTPETPPVYCVQL
jgi:prepilin-type N-terminal cleavage/methylation domain-containing protein